MCVTMYTSPTTVHSRNFHARALERISVSRPRSTSQIPLFIPRRHTLPTRSIEIRERILLQVLIITVLVIPTKRLGIVVSFEFPVPGSVAGRFVRVVWGDEALVDVWGCTGGRRVCRIWRVVVFGLVGWAGLVGRDSGVVDWACGVHDLSVVCECDGDEE